MQGGSQASRTQGAVAEGPIRYRDRASGAIVEESSYGHDTLRFLYRDRRGRLLTDHILSRRFASRVFGWWQRSPGSRRKIPQFARSLGIDLAESARPLESFRSIDDFFTRRLVPGARPVTPDPARLVAPADGRVLVAPEVGGGPLHIKGGQVSLEDLVADKPLAARYTGGAALIVRLAFSDYHRFHFPDGGVASPPRAVGRRLHSVHTIALGAGAPSFRNRRVMTELESDGFGRLLIIDIGALFVGTIVETYRPGRVARGDEKGYFRFGGSTVVILAEPGRLQFDADLLAWSTLGAPDPIETLVRMGTPIARQARGG